MKVEAALSGRPIVSSQFLERSVVRKSESTMTKEIEIESLTNLVSEIKLDTKREQEEQEKCDKTTKENVNDIILNIKSEKEDALLEKTEHERSVQQGTDETDVKEEENTVKTEIVKEIKEEQEEDESKVKSLKEEDGVLHPRGPDRRSHGTPRDAPYKIHSTYNQESLGSCYINTTGYASFDSVHQIAVLPSGSTEYHEVNIFDIEESSLSPSTSDITQLQLDDLTDVRYDELFRGDISPYHMREMLQDCTEPRDILEVEPLIPTTITDLEESPPSNAGGSPPQWGSYTSIPSVSIESGYNSARDSPSPSDPTSYIPGYEAWNAFRGSPAAESPLGSSYTGGISPGYGSQSPTSIVGSPYGSYGVSSPESAPVYQNLQTLQVREIVAMPQVSCQSRAKARIQSRLDENLKKSTWAKVSAMKDDDVAKGDEAGDTQLMILLVNSESKIKGKLEFVYALVERLKDIAGALTRVNGQHQAALEMSAVYYPGADRALVTTYIAETLVETGADLNVLNESGDGLLHILCRDGDSNYEVLSELIAVKNVNGAPAFDLDLCNMDGCTPIEEAVMNHNSGRVRACSVVQLLINAGASKMTASNGTSLLNEIVNSTRCDPTLVSVLLSAPSTSRHTSYGEATPLHLAAARNDLPIETQASLVGMLVGAGFVRGVRDARGRLPMDLVEMCRREELKRIAKI